MGALVYIIIIIIVLFIYRNKETTKNFVTESEQQRQARLQRERKARELAEAERLKEKIFIESLQPDISNLNKKFDLFLNYKSGYFNNNKLVSWKSIANSFYSDISKKKTESLELDSSVFGEISKFKTNYLQSDKLRKEYNESFIKHELEECDAFFSNIENASLDSQQRLAIVKDEDNNLIIAGAGSGKTTTVGGKVAYVIDRFKIKPEEILLITFTKKASDEMKERIRKKMGIDIEVNTFHSFGRNVIGEVTNNMPSVIEGKQFYTEMRKGV